jgi:hypothetical protein
MTDGPIERGAGRDRSFVVTLAYPPTWYASEGFWSTRDFNHFVSTLPWGSKPHANVDAVDSETVASVIDRASEAIGLVPGPTNQATTMSEFMARMSFYKAEDDTHFDIQRIYQSPRELPVVLGDGTVELERRDKPAWRKE